MNSNYNSPSDALASVYASDNAPTAPTRNNLDMSTFVDPGVIRSTDTPSVPLAPSSAPMAIRTAYGSPVHDPAAVTPDDVVEIAPGQETSVAVAIMMGLMGPNAAGHIVPIGQTAPASTTEQRPNAERQPEQEKQPEPNPKLDAESEAILTRAFTEAPSETIGVAVAAIDGDGVVPAAVVENLAARMNMEPAEAALKIEQAKAAFATEAVAVTAKTFGTSQEVVRDALAAIQHSDATKSAFRQAAQAHFNSGRPDGYANLVKEWVAGLDQTDPARILDANPVEGRAVRFDRASKQVLVKLPNGMEMPWGVAVRQGLFFIK